MDCAFEAIVDRLEDKTMGITLRKLMNPLRGYAAPPQTTDRCLCGKGVMFADDGSVKPHRPRVDGHKNRKARQSSWCSIPALIKAAVEKGSAAGMSE